MEKGCRWELVLLLSLKKCCQFFFSKIMAFCAAFYWMEGITRFAGGISSEPRVSTVL